MHKITWVAVLIIITGMGCSGRLMPRADDEAMLVYRECMNDASQQIDINRTSSALSSNATRQSVSTVSKTQRESYLEVECARAAGWKGK